MNEVTVGDKLVFRLGHGNKLAIHKVDRITPSGRIVCGQWTLNSDLSIRGRSGYGGPYRGEVMTAKLQVQYNRQRAMETITTAKLDDIDTLTLCRVAKELSSSPSPPRSKR